MSEIEFILLVKSCKGAHGGLRVPVYNHWSKLIFYLLKYNTYFGSLVPEGAPPELCSIRLGDAEVVTLKQTVGEDGLQLSKHVTEDQRQLGEVPPVEIKKSERDVSCLYRCTVVKVSLACRAAS